MREIAFPHRIVLDLRTRPKSIEMKGRAVFEGEECFKLIAHYDGQVKVEELHFSAATGLLRAIDRPRTDVPNSVSVAYRFADWKTSGDVTLSRKISLKAAEIGTDVSWEMTAAVFNDVKAAVFDTPIVVESMKKCGTPSETRDARNSPNGSNAGYTEEQISVMSLAQAKDALERNASMRKAAMDSNDAAAQQRLKSEFERLMSRIREIRAAGDSDNK